MPSVQFENGKLIVDVTENNGQTKLSFKGQIDEDFIPDKLLGSANKNFLVDFQPGTA